jgi:hypothetical protein
MTTPEGPQKSKYSGPFGFLTILGLIFISLVGIMMLLKVIGVGK